MEKITKDTVLADILALAGAEAILAKFRVPCLTCPMAQMEMPSLRIGEVCKMYGLNQNQLLIELNKLIGGTSSKSKTKPQVKPKTIKKPAKPKK